MQLPRPRAAPSSEARNPWRRLRYWPSPRRRSCRKIRQKTLQSCLQSCLQSIAIICHHVRQNLSEKHAEEKLADTPKKSLGIASFYHSICFSSQNLQMAQRCSETRYGFCRAFSGPFHLSQPVKACRSSYLQFHAVHVGLEHAFCRDVIAPEQPVGSCRHSMPQHATACHSDTWPIYRI